MEKNKLLDNLVVESVLSDFQKSILNSSQDWVNDLISIMRRKSFANFKKFIFCLQQTGLIAPFGITNIGMCISFCVFHEFFSTIILNG